MYVLYLKLYFIDLTHLRFPKVVISRFIRKAAYNLVKTSFHNDNF